MSIDIFTVTVGREFYLKKTLAALESQSNRNFNHFLVLNDCAMSEELESCARRLGSKIIRIDERVSIGTAIDFVKPLLGSEHTMKLDDDAVVQGADFIKHVHQVIELKPEAVFSPFPVGLIGNFGGPRSDKRSVAYGAGMDTYYTFRHVKHVGGFARVNLRSLYDQIAFNKAQHSEDAEFSKYCGQKDIDMFYLENALIVEHAESTLGQMARDKDYFARSRSWMSDLKP